MHTVCPHPLTSLNIGKCYLYINKKDEAKKWLEEAANFRSSQIQSEGAAHAHVSPFRSKLMSTIYRIVDKFSWGSIFADCQSLLFRRFNFH